MIECPDQNDENYNENTDIETLSSDDTESYDINYDDDEDDNDDEATENCNDWSDATEELDESSYATYAKIGDNTIDICCTDNTMKYEITEQKDEIDLVVSDADTEIYDIAVDEYKETFDQKSLESISSLTSGHTWFLVVFSRLVPSVTKNLKRYSHFLQIVLDVQLETKSLLYLCLLKSAKISSPTATKQSLVLNWLRRVFTKSDQPESFTLYRIRNSCSCKLCSYLKVYSPKSRITTRASWRKLFQNNFSYNLARIQHMSSNIEVHTNNRKHCKFIADEKINKRTGNN